MAVSGVGGPRVPPRTASSSSASTAQAKSASTAGTSGLQGYSASSFFEKADVTDRKKLIADYKKELQKLRDHGTLTDSGDAGKWDDANNRLTDYAYDEVCKKLDGLLKKDGLSDEAFIEQLEGIQNYAESDALMNKSFFENFINQLMEKTKELAEKFYKQE